jgi:hypothetical protein
MRPYLSTLVYSGLLSIGALAGASAFAGGISSSLPDNALAVGPADAAKTLPAKPLADGQIWNHSCIAEACQGKFEPAVLVLKPSDSTASGLQFVRGGFGGFRGGGGFHGFGGGGFHGFGGGFHGFGGGFPGFGGFHGFGGFRGFGGFPGMGGFRGFHGFGGGFHGFHRGFYGMRGFRGFHGMAGFHGFRGFRGFHGFHTVHFHHRHFFFNNGGGWNGWGWYGLGLPWWYLYCDPYYGGYYGSCYY